MIERIHHLLKPSFLADNIPREVLIWVHFYHIKDQFMAAFHKNSQPPAQYAPIQIFADLSQYTMQKCKALLSETKALQNHKIPYHWGDPVKLTIIFRQHFQPEVSAKLHRDFFFLNWKMYLNINLVFRFSHNMVALNCLVPCPSDGYE